MSVASRSTRSALYRDFYDLIPLFATHAPQRPVPKRWSPIRLTRTISTTRCPQLQLESHTSRDPSPLLQASDNGRRELPRSCPGCGAPTQTIHSGEAGFYSPTRAAVRKYLHPVPVKKQGGKKEDAVVKATLDSVPLDIRRQLGLDGLVQSRDVSNDYGPSTPICDRCHNLIHYHSGIPINHPSLDAIEATIAESPHKYNHIYHVLDAADFPMSLLPSLHHRLDFGWLRGRNRRAKNQHWSGGQSGEMSFIITRSDLLAPRKEQVDSLMPQLREILRNSLGRMGDDKRLGNVRLVSSKRGWWTKDVKEAIWERGGGGWLVGKANVGKSSLFEVVFPKGTTDETPKFDQIRKEARMEAVQAALEASSNEPLIDGEQIGATDFQPVQSELAKEEYDSINEQAFDDTLSLLPPAQPETKYPVMPIISSLPGTTASPIRVPFGNGKGELIDLPGLERPSLEAYIKPENQLDIVMKHRITPERHVIKPGSSLLLGGGLIRITPKTPDLVFMAHAFMPMSAHLTATQKAMELEEGERDINIPSILHEEKKGAVKSAGTFMLESDVTKKHAGPLTRKDAVGLRTSKLPFVVWATDILIEGCGWVEIVAQVRKAKRSLESEQVDKIANAKSSPWSPLTARSDDDIFSARESRRRRNVAQSQTELSNEETAATMPEIEVFSPEGKFVGQRPSLSCWLLGGPNETKKGKRSGRPRKSMKGMKKLEKARRRTSETTW